MSILASCVLDLEGGVDMTPFEEPRSSGSRSPEGVRLSQLRPGCHVVQQMKQSSASVEFGGKAPAPDGYERMQ